MRTHVPVIQTHPIVIIDNKLAICIYQFIREAVRTALIILVIIMMLLLHSRYPQTYHTPNIYPSWKDTVSTEPETFMSKIYEIGGQGNENLFMIQAWNLKVWVKKISSVFIVLKLK